jgi:hypothetical protein
MIEAISKAFIAAMWLGAFAIGFCFGCVVAILYCLGWVVVKIFQGLVWLGWQKKK